MSIEFWATALIVTITPGTGALFTIGAGLTRGARASIVAAAGCTLGIVPHLAAAVSGAALLVSTSRAAFEVLKWAGVCYLLWMAVATWRDRGVLAVESDGTPPSDLRTIMTAVGVNLLNPKLTLFFFAFLPQFVPPGDEVVAEMLALSGAFMGLTLMVFVVYGLAAASVREVIVERPRVMTWMRRVFAVSFVALGARLAVTA